MEQENKELDWESVKKALGLMQAEYEERPVEETLANFIRQCGYEPHPMLVNLDQMAEVDANLGVIVTHQNSEINNGVYIFVVLRDHRQGLITVLPSTRSKGPMIRKTAGDLTQALLGVAHPPMTPFDMVELTAQILHNTVWDEILAAYNVPKEKRQAFLYLYAPKFLAAVAAYYVGQQDASGKPLVSEEIVDMEPALIRKRVLGETIPEAFRALAGDEKEPEPESGASPSGGPESSQIHGTEKGECIC